MTMSSRLMQNSSVGGFRDTQVMLVTVRPLRSSPRPTVTTLTAPARCAMAFLTRLRGGVAHWVHVRVSAQAIVKARNARRFPELPHSG